MQETINLSVTPFQAILALAFNIWIVVFPIMIMQKIDRLINLMESREEGQSVEGDERDPSNENEEG